MMGKNNFLKREPKNSICKGTVSRAKLDMFEKLKESRVIRVQRPRRNIYVGT